MSSIGQVDSEGGGRCAVRQTGVRGPGRGVQLRRRTGHRGLLRAHHARRSHRHHRTERLRQDDAHQTAHGRARADGGVRSIGARRSKPAYFDQQRDALDPAASIMDNVTAGSGDMVTIGGRTRHVSGYLRDFLFPPERLHAPVSMLSGGERNRLLLAKLFAQAEQSSGDGRAHQRSRCGDLGSDGGDGRQTMRGPAVGEPRPRVSRQRRDRAPWYSRAGTHRRICRRLHRFDASTAGEGGAAPPKTPRQGQRRRRGRARHPRRSRPSKENAPTRTSANSMRCRRRSRRSRRSRRRCRRF